MDTCKNIPLEVAKKSKVTKLLNSYETLIDSISENLRKFYIKMLINGVIIAVVVTLMTVSYFNEIKEKANQIKIEELAKSEKEKALRISKLLLTNNKQEAELYQLETEKKQVERNIKLLEEKLKTIPVVKIAKPTINKKPIVKTFHKPKRKIKTKPIIASKHKTMVPCNSNGDHVIESGDSRICMNLITGFSIVEKK